MSTDGAGARPQGDTAGEGDDAETSVDDGRPVDDVSASRPKGRALRRTLMSLGILGLVLAVLLGGGLWFLTERYAGNIDRISDVFDGLDEDSRPAPASPAQEAGDDPVTFLLVG